MTLFRIFRLTFYAVFIIGLCAVYYVYSQAIRQPLENRELKLEIPSGVGVAWLANHLQRQGHIDNRHLARLYIWLNDSDILIKEGEYTLVDVQTLPELMQKIESGKVIQYAVTLIEGWNFKQYVAHLKQQKGLTDELEGMSDAQIMRAVGSPGKHPEGMFAPETYYYQKGDSDLDILKQSHKRLNRYLQDAWAQKADDLQLNTAYELLIMASIIEKETGAAEERGIISGVFNNRLKIGMKLQTDPTVIYGMGESYDGNIRRRDLTTDTPYNTYTRYGLPPSPIAMAGYDAIMAAARPETTDALYFVGKGDGTHYFSENLRQHNNAVIKYQLGGKPRKFSSN